MKYVRTVKQREPEELKLDLSLFKKKSSSKSFRGYLVGKMKKARDDGNIEMVHLLNHILQKYNELEVKSYSPKQWRGASGVNFIEHPDYVVAVRHKKDDIDEKPKETRTELSREAINKVLKSIYELDKGSPLKTSEIAELTYQRSWKGSIYGDRQTHIRLTEILNYLEYKNKIKYSRRGMITVIR